MRNRAIALSVLETIANSLEGMKKTALLAVQEWVFQNTFKIPDGHEDRERLITELKENDRNLMTKAERIEEARFFLDGIPHVLEVK
jgi:hypothetical protein